MGWCNDAYPDHEGWLIGWERAAAPPGERSWAHDKTLQEIKCPPGLGPVGSVEIEVWAVQIGCECGWRSPLLRAPLGTVWAPCCVFLPKREQETDETDALERLNLAPAFEKECRSSWHEHLATMLPGCFFSRKFCRR